MIIVVDNKRELLSYMDRMIAVSCIVRNELNGWRQDHEVVKTIPGEIPYMPRVFPVGEWNVKYPVAREHEYKAPYYIPTDAFQMVDEWVLSEGKYYAPSGRKVKDTAYGLHFSTSGTTLGCIKILEEKELITLTAEIMKALDRKEPVKLIVEAA